MSDRPILFSAPMIRALLDGRKAQTRRVLKPQPRFPDSATSAGLVGLGEGRAAVRFHGKGVDSYVIPLPYAPSDRLWCRETHYVESAGYKDGSGQRIIYRADEPEASAGGWSPSIFMPRWASRLTLTVTDVRVQRVQEISEADARAEGAEPILVPPDGGSAPHVEGFRDLWNSLNAKRGFGWNANPWVVALTFTVHRCNIDQMRDAA